MLLHMQNLMRYCVFILLLNSAFTAVCAQQLSPCDKNATQPTINLFNNLRKISEKGFLFGHEDATAYGVNWKNKPNKSDINDVVGDFPALYGWDISYLELHKHKNIDNVRFKKQRRLVQQAFANGAVNTFSWHCSSPLSAKNGAWDTTHASVASILPRGKNHEMYKKWLDRIAIYFKSLKDANGKPIPILFRPFHELTGNWFWWGRNACTDLEYKALWRFTVEYLRDDKHLHNLLYVYNTADNFDNENEYLARYPGDDMVDIISFDSYQYANPKVDSSFRYNTTYKLLILKKIATNYNKLFALAETGYEAIPSANWWTNMLLPAIENSGISYVLLWRNAGYSIKMKKMHYYVPFKGQISEADFKLFYANDRTLFQKEVGTFKLYN